MFPVTVVEAFSSRLPVICSDLSTLKELVEPGVTGLTFSAGDPAALAERVRWAVANPSALEEIGRRAQAIYEECYTPEVNFSRLMDIYSLLRGDRRLWTRPVLPVAATRHLRRQSRDEPGRP